MLVPVIVEVIAGLIVVWVAIRGRQGRLSRDGVGVFLILSLLGAAIGVRASRSVP